MPPRVPAIAPGSRHDLGEVEARILAQRGRISTLYRVLLNSPPVASGWEQLLTAIRRQSSLSPRLRELVILRVAVLNQAAYEFDAHVPHALAAGLTPEQVQAVRRRPLPASWAASDRLVLELADAVTTNVQVPSPLMDLVQQAFDARETVELVCTIAAYNMVSRVLVALDIGS